eukprot:Gb_18392 [translate_table: standard]
MASSSIHGVLNALIENLSGAKNYSTREDTMQPVFTLYKLWGYITDKILEPTDIDPQNLKEVRNQLEGVGETIEDKEMVLATISNLPREGPSNLGPFIISLCTQGCVMSILFNDFKGLLLREESLRNAGTSKGDSSGAYGIKYKGKAPM